MIRVIQWATGAVGKVSLRHIIDDPELELVGVIVHDEDKHGRDAGELAGTDSVGILATTDAAAVVALDADVVCYHALGDKRSWKAVADICTALRAGKDVVSTSVIPLVYPPGANPEQVAQLEEACAAGGTSCLMSGIDPGFMHDVLPLTLTELSRRVDSIWVAEILNYVTYDQPEVLFDMMGFGQPIDVQPSFHAPGVATWGWGSVVHGLAARLGVSIERFEEFHEVWAAPERIETPLGVIEPGTIAAQRFELRGFVGGVERLTVGHITRMRDDAAPEWPQPPGSGGYRLVIAGDPAFTCDIQFADEATGDAHRGVMTAGAMRTINAIKAVHAAAPGVLDAYDLPATPGRMSR